jgi:hypothetical protein
LQEITTMRALALPLALVTALLVAGVVFAQDDVLAQMKKDAEIVAHVKVLEIQGGDVFEAGVVEWFALCEVVDPIKGPIKKGDQIRFHFNQFGYHDEMEPKPVEKGKEYVIFLKGEAGGIRFTSDDKLYVVYELLDHWVGALPYHFHLAHRLKEYLKDE